MAYNDLILREEIQSKFLVIIKPKIEQSPSAWTTYAGTTWYFEFDFGYAIQMVEGGVVRDLASDRDSVGTNEWFYEVSTKRFYYSNGVGNPAGTTLYITYELYFGTVDTEWHRIPDDTTSDQVYYHPLINAPPNLNILVSEYVFGFSPVSSTSITLNNHDHTLEKHLFDASFINRDISIWHCLDKLKVANLKEIYVGVTQNVSYNQATVRFTINEPISKLFNQFQNPSGEEQTYTTATFSGLDPNKENFTVRYVYGVVGELKAVNIDYEADAPSTTTNRDWAVRSLGSELHNEGGSIIAGSTSTTTNLATGEADGFTIGDHIRVIKTATEYVRITDINYTTDVITHTPYSGAAPTSGNTIDRLTISNVMLEQAGKSYRLMPHRDYSQVVVSGVLVARLTSSAESNVGASTITPSDIIHCRVYGKQNDVTLGGPAFGTDNTETNNLTSSAVIMIDLLVNFAGIPESEIDTTRFTALLTELATEHVSFAIPRSETDPFPTYRELIQLFLKTHIMAFFQTSNNLWSVERYRSLNTVEYTIGEDEIIKDSITYGISYSDIISDAIIQYAFREYSNSFRSISVNYTRPESLHDVKKSRTFPTILLDQVSVDSEIQNIGDRFVRIFGERRGTYSLTTKNRFFNTDVYDRITVSLEKLPGFDFVSGTVNSRNFNIIQTNKGLGQITLVLDDQKGERDNQAFFPT